MLNSSRDPDLQSLASAVRQTREVKKRPRPAPDVGPAIAILFIVIVAGLSAVAFVLAQGRNSGAPASADADAVKSIAPPQPGDAKPIQAMSHPRAAAMADDRTVVVTVVSATVEPIELFPVKKSKPAPTTSHSKLFGRIPDPEEQPKRSDPLLAIRVRIQNKSGARIDYRPWNHSTPLLADDERNVYAFCQFNDYLPRGRVMKATSMAAGESLEDLLIFERPAATIRSLDLRLPGRNVGTTKPILIPISPSQVAGL